MKGTQLTQIVLVILLLAGCTSVATRTQIVEPPTARPETPATGILTTRPTARAAVQVQTAQPVIASAEPVDFWTRLRDGFALRTSDQRVVAAQIRTYGSHPGDVEKIFRRASPYLAYILAEVEKRNYPTEIALLPFVESGYDPFAYSHGRAAGLWQFIPGTGRMYGLKQDWWYDGRRDVVESTTAALDYLGRLHKEFGGDWQLALAAYNSGGGTVRNAIRRNRLAGRPTDFWHLSLPRETAAYVPRLLAISAIVRQPDRYGVSLAALEPLPAFSVSDTQGQLDLAVAAELAGMETAALHRLNPGYNRWATHPDGPHQLAIPADRLDSFRENLAQLPDTQRTRWVRHKIKRGETLSHIASHYDTTVAVLRSTNTLSSTRIRAGRYLLVPVAARDPSQYASLNGKHRSSSTASQKLTYTVQNGDNLWDIARRHQVSVQQVSHWNGLDASKLIRPGQRLVIHARDSGNSSEKQIRTIKYTVRRGDSLYKIARKFDVSIQDVRRWNNLPRDKYLQPGQRLRLYINVTDLARN
jgi:membrane-bound lytic murein transglycosylase D